MCEKNYGKVKEWKIRFHLSSFIVIVLLFNQYWFYYLISWICLERDSLMKLTMKWGIFLGFRLKNINNARWCFIPLKINALEIIIKLLNNNISVILDNITAL